MQLAQGFFLLSCSLLASHPALAQVVGQVDRGDVAIHYQVFGEGFPVVLLSGGPGASSTALMPIARKLDDEYKVVLIDQRGTGLSQLAVLDSTTITLKNYVEDVEAVRRHLGIERWLIIGHSWGGGLAMAVTAAHPRHSAGMVLIGSIGIDLEYLDYAFDNLNYSESDLATLKFWSDPERRAADPERAAYEYYRALLPSRLYRSTDMLQILENLVVEQDFSTIAPLMTKDLIRVGYDLRPALRAYEGPVLVLQGRQGFLGGRTAEKIVQTIPNAEIAFIEKCGHFPFVEQPEAFFASLAGFLQTHFR
ncbi:MAG: alpha/beta hydrolase [Rhodothermia bacterium]|nr:alpha/beta hydrolase [Rhodothermia bacterium]